jgi:hypothetical protein
MKLHIMLSLAILALAAGPALAAAAAADPGEGFEIHGVVTAFTASPGSGLPMITVDVPPDETFDVGLGPLWYLQAEDFSVAEGDEVDAFIFPCDTCSAPYVAAWVDNLTQECSIQLRDPDTGRPEWSHRNQYRGGTTRPGQGRDPGTGGGTGGGTGSGSGGGSGQPGGSGNGTGTGPGLPGGIGGLDMTQVQTVTGTVVDFVGHAGSGQPTLTLDAAGETWVIVVSPYQPVEAAGLIIEPGLGLEVTFAPTICSGEPLLVTIAITDLATGMSIQLRDPETGFPMAPGGGHNRPNWP